MAIEHNHDERGIAPFEVVICPLGYAMSAAVREAADALYAELLEAGVGVLLDDRDGRPEVMLIDWELIRAPVRLVRSTCCIGPPEPQVLGTQGRRLERGKSQESRGGFRQLIRCCDCMNFTQP